MKWCKKSLRFLHALLTCWGRQAKPATMPLKFCCCTMSSSISNCWHWISYLNDIAFYLGTILNKQNEMNMIPNKILRTRMEIIESWRSVWVCKVIQKKKKYLARYPEAGSSGNKINGQPLWANPFRVVCKLCQSAIWWYYLTCYGLTSLWGLPNNNGCKNVLCTNRSSSYKNYLLSAA